MADANEVFEKNIENNCNEAMETLVNESKDYVEMIQTKFSRSLFPNDFDDWTMSEKYDWINKNLSKFYPNVPKSLLHVIPACFRTDCGSAMEKPEWLDIDKYHRGQKFIQNYLMQIIVTIALSLIPAYTFQVAVRPIILSNNAHTPYLAFKRYLSSINRMMKWFTGEPWMKETPAFKEMQVVRKIHIMVKKTMSQLSDDKINSGCKFSNPWCTSHELLLKDFIEACPFEKIEQRPYKSFDLPFKYKYMNDADMAWTVCCFTSFIILYPQDFGVHDATDDDLEAYCHLWRCYGYYLGIEDKNNFCRGNLEEIKQRSRDFLQYWVIPNFKDITPEWEHMTRCLVTSMNYFPFMSISYKTAILLITDSLGINMPRLRASLTFLYWINYKIFKFLLRYALKLSCIRSLFNKLILYSLNQATNLSQLEKVKLRSLSMQKVQEFSISL